MGAAIDVTTASQPEHPFPALVEAAGPLTFGVWAAPSCVAVLLVVSALTKGGFWLHSAEVVGAGSLVLLLLVAVQREGDRMTALVLFSSVALAAWWFVRATATGQPSSFFPFGVSILGFAGAFAALRPLTSKQRELAAVVLASLGAFEALVGYVGVVVRSSPLAIPDQNLWRLASTVTYSNAAGLILAMSLLVALGLNERWWYSRGLVCLCTAGLLATQSRGAYIGVACGMLVVPFARFRESWLPLALGTAAGFVAIVTSPNRGAQPVVAVVLVLCVSAGAALRPGPFALATRRRMGPVAVAVAGVAGVGLAAIVSHGVLARRFLSSASLFDRNPEWSSAYHQFLGAPWLGTGPDRLIPLLGTGGSLAHFASNEYLQVAADAGVIGLLLLACVAVAVVRSVRRIDVGTSCALGALIAFGVCGAFDFDWHLPMIALMGGCVAALAGVTTLRRHRTVGRPPLPAWFAPEMTASRRRPTQSSEKDQVKH